MGFRGNTNWMLDRNAGVIFLEHLRRDPDHPVFPNITKIVFLNQKPYKKYSLKIYSLQKKPFIFKLAHK